MIIEIDCFKIKYEKDGLTQILVDGNIEYFQNDGINHNNLLIRAFNGDDQKNLEELPIKTLIEIIAEVTLIDWQPLIEIYEQERQLKEYCRESDLLQGGAND